MGQLSYPPRDVTMALTELAARAGDIDATSELLIDDRFQVPAATLRLWMLDSHAEQYKRLVSELGHRQEEKAIGDLRRQIADIGSARELMVERVSAITEPALVPNALRALSDAQAKSTNMLLQLTGRPVNGDRGGSSAIELVKAMVDGGLLRPTEGITLEPIRVPNEAETP